MEIARLAAVEWWKYNKGDAGFCDFCSSPIHRDNGYLTTTDMVLNSKFWREEALPNNIEKSFQRFGSQLTPEKFKEILRLSLIQFAFDRTPWLLCKVCYTKFMIGGEIKENVSAS